MTKKHFIELADLIRRHNQHGGVQPFDSWQITVLADFCQQTNPRFNRQQWLDYINKP